MKTLRLGCIADDFTGATDLASNFVQNGMRVMQIMGIPSEQALPDDVDVVVIALKSRTVPVQEAVEQSLQALTWLRIQGAEQIYFKYCSTFDSTSDGNIGPVTDALMDALGCDFTIACPAFPENGRTVFKGHLFVGGDLLQESGMKNHPLTPMTDSNLVRVLQAQTKHRVGLIDEHVVLQGAQAIQERMNELRDAGYGVAVIDAIRNEDLMAMGAAFAELLLITAGSGVAIGLPQNFKITPSAKADQLPVAGGYQAIVSGSCSVATNRQVAHFIAQGGKAFALDPLALSKNSNLVNELIVSAVSELADGPVLIYATASAESVQAVQTQLGVGNAGEMVEAALSTVARRLVEAGVGQLIVAGGETSGACVQALNIQSMRIGPAIAPGVPWCFARTDVTHGRGIHITLKSGNFGQEQFFSESFELLKH